MQRVFWVTCPASTGRFHCQYTLRHARVNLECPLGHARFLADESPELDERWCPSVQAPV